MFAPRHPPTDLGEELGVHALGGEQGVGLEVRGLPAAGSDLPTDRQRRPRGDRYRKAPLPIYVTGDVRGDIDATC
jgi:hypothetical protein